MTYAACNTRLCDDIRNAGDRMLEKFCVSSLPSPSKSLKRRALGDERAPSPYAPPFKPPHSSAEGKELKPKP